MSGPDYDAMWEQAESEHVAENHRIIVSQKRRVRLRELALFAGGGGGLLASHLIGWRTVCAVEIDPYCRGRLIDRQRDGCLPEFPIWDDVRTFDGRPWCGYVDVLSGGFPCQDISGAGGRRGINGKRSGLWFEMARIIGEVRPAHVFVENTQQLVRRGLVQVLSDLAEMGYDARWTIVGANHVGATHLRKRLWLWGTQGVISDAIGGQVWEQWQRGRKQCGQSGEIEFRGHGAEGGVARQKDGWWEVEPDVGRVVDGVAFGVDRLCAIGNGQVPSVAALAWLVLTKGY